MISQALQGSLRSVADSYVELATTLGRVASELSLMNRQPDSGTIQSMSAAVGNEATQLGSVIPTIPPQNLAGALAAALTAFRNTQAFANSHSQIYLAVVQQQATANMDLARQQFEAIQNAVQDGIDEIETTGTWPQGHGYNLGQIRYAVDDLASYPILTTESDGGSTRTPSPGGVGIQSIQRTVDVAMRQTLGRLPKYTDATAFTAALTASFAISETQGHSVVEWRPRSYIGQRELGGQVTGAQASVYARAAEASGAVMPLLTGLVALRPDADPEEMDAARSVVAAEFTAVVAELGTEGGPRSLRVDRLFATLLSDTVIGIDNQPVTNGMVGYLGNVYGLEPGRVNTIAEEQNFSNYLLVRDYIESTRASWQTFFQNSFGRDLGTRLVLLSNALQVVAETIDEIEAAMDSVFVGTSERTVARFSTGSGGSMLVSEFLTWVTSFATQEAPDLVQSAGRRAMVAVVSTSNELNTVAGDLLRAIQSGTGIPDGLRHPRVRHPLEELRTYLSQVTQLAQQVQVA
jgi:hypothetical protein